jgi:hypothetical protein
MKDLKKNLKKKQATEADKLAKFKGDIREYFSFFEENIKNYKRWMSFAFKDTMTGSERAALTEMSRPKIQINYTDPYLSRLLGEYSSMTPEPVVRGDGSGDPMNVQLTDVTERHLSHVFDVYNKYHRNRVIQEQCGGGFSAFKVIPDYSGKKTFRQILKLVKCKDPTLVFFDPMDRSHAKEESKMWGELHPFEKEDFKDKYPDYAEYAEELGYADTGIAPFSYKNKTKDILVLAEYYRKEYVNKNLLELADNQVMYESEYNEMVREWREIAPPPIEKRRRKVREEVVKRYLFIGNKILEEETLAYPGCNYFFIPGKDAWVYADEASSQVEQVTCSFIKNAVDPQRMLNGMAQAIAAFSENIMAQKYIIEETTLSDPESWKEPNTPGNLLWRAMPDGQHAMPPPQVVQQQDLPQSLVVMYQSMQQTLQNALGSYDASLGIQDKELSGIAFENAATQNNAVSMPYFMSYLASVNAASAFMLKMMPIYYVTPMTIPIVDKEGKRSFVAINQQLPNGETDPNGLQLKFDEEDLEVEVTAGQTFALQKDKSLKAMVTLMQAVPAFADVMNRKGLPIIVDQLDIRKVDTLKEIVREDEEEKEKMKQQQGHQPNPMQVEIQMKQQEMMMKQQKDQMDAQIKIKQLQLEQEKLTNEMRIAEIQLAQSTANDAIQHEKVMAEIKSHRIDAATSLVEADLRHNDQLHRHTMDVMKMHDSRENEKAKRMINDFPIKMG